MLYFMVSLVSFFTFIVFKGRRCLLEFSSNKFDLKKIKLFKKENFLSLELLGVVPVILVFFLSSKVARIIFILFYMLLSLIEIRKVKGVLKVNDMIKYIVIKIIIYLIIFGAIFIDYYNYEKGFIFYDRSNYYYIIVFLIGYLEYFIIYLSVILGKKIGNKVATGKR